MRGKIELIEEEFLKKRIAKFSPGDTVQIHIKSKDQDRERIQIFEGIVIAIKGTGLSKMVTVRKIVQGEGVERIFPVHSPKISKITVKKRGRVRRAKLYYLRELGGRKARVEEIFVTADKEHQAEEEAEEEEKKEEKKQEPQKVENPTQAQPVQKQETT